MSTISPQHRLDSSERRTFFIVAALFLAVLILPYLWVATIAPNGMLYGGLLYNPDDQNVHLAWARQAAEGHFFFRDLFTTESLINGERPLFTNLFCYFIGVVSALTHLPAIWLYHLLRVIFAGLALWWFYNLCALLTSDKRTRALALVLVGFSGGAGWLQALMPGRTFIDRPDGSLMMPEAFTFTSAFIFPLYIASMALLIAVLWQVELARRTEALRPVIWAALAALLLSNIHTYDVIPLNLLLLAWAVKGFMARKQASEAAGKMAWLAPLGAIAGTLPPLVYQLYVFKNSSEFQIKALTKTSAPPFLDIALSYGPLLLLALIGAAVVWQARQGRLMLLWFGLTFACMYAPVSFARKMIEGLHLPMCFLAATGLVFLISKIPAGGLMRRGAGAVVVLMLSISSFQFVGWCLENARDNNFSRAGVFMPPLYLAESDQKALRFLDNTTARDKAVLCLPFLGNYVPRETGRFVYVGHWAETLNFFNPETKTGKIVDTQRFFGLSRPMDATEARQWLRANHIGYVIVGSYENQFGVKLPLELKPVYSEGGTTVYEVPAA